MTTLRIAVPLALAFGLPAAAADEGGEVSRADIAAQLNNVEAEDITESPLPGLYEVAVGSTVAYVSKDGRYLVQGEVYDLDTSENLTESSRASKRVSLLETADRDSMIVFSPEGEVEHTVTMFTDIDCGYCRQFHREIEQVNALGIEVRYLSYPRSGPDTESWTKARKVWCAEDRHAAITRAKLGDSVAEETCAEAPIESHYELGEDVGVRGTPAIYSAGGVHVGGYLAPEKLAQQLDELAAEGAGQTD